jgi:glutamyl-tRNA synthetase
VPEDSSERIRVRFAPSPTGYLHIGGARTVLFNWLVARQAGGTFVLRIEDTDQSRHVEDSVQKILDDLRWLSLTWDEGPQAGGDYGPYFQSQRLDIYNRYLWRLLESREAYYALETREELAAMRRAAEKKTGGFRYPRPEPLPTIEQGEAARAEGRAAVVRFKMPDADITVVDEILGEVTLAADQHEDFVIRKSDGFPTYHFACVVDDELMKISHVLRGQEHLMNTPKHVALQRALGFSTPRYGHMPVIFNMDGSKMSKRDKEKATKKGQPPPEIDVHDFRVAGYLPEAVVNFIALLGWNPGDDREQFSLDELASAFSIDRIGKTNARFDRRKLLAFNTDWAARVSEDRLLEAFKDYQALSQSVGPTSQSSVGPMSQPSVGPASRSSVGPPFQSVSGARDKLIYQPTGNPPTDDDLRAVLKSCAGFRTFPDVMKKAGFLFTPDDVIEYDPKAVKKVLAKNDGAGYAMLEYLLPKFTALQDWTAEALETLIKTACDEKQTGMGDVAQPIRVAVTGSTISPSIHDSLVMLGKYHTIARIKRCLERRT